MYSVTVTRHDGRTSSFDIADPLRAVDAAKDRLADKRTARVSVSVNGRTFWQSDRKGGDRPDPHT